MPTCGNTENATHTWDVLWNALKGLAIWTAFKSIILNKSNKITHPTTKTQTGRHSSQTNGQNKLQDIYCAFSHITDEVMHWSLSECEDENFTATYLGHTFPSPPLKWIINHKMSPHLFNQTDITQGSMNTEPHETLCFEVTSETWRLFSLPVTLSNWQDGTLNCVFLWVRIWWKEFDHWLRGCITTKESHCATVQWLC